MADDSAVLTAFREELIAANLVRRPSESTPAGKRPMFISPAEGARAPGDGEGTELDNVLVVSIFAGGDLSEATGFDAAIQRRTTIDVHYRAATSAGERELMALDAAIRKRLIRPETNYGYGFVMGSAAPVFVQQAGVWGGLGPVSRAPGFGVDYVAKYLIAVAP